MEKTEVFPVSAPSRGDSRAGAVIAAAGSFSRMEGVAKQMVLLDGVPVIVHTLWAFQRAEQIREIVIAARKTDVPVFAALCRQHGLDKVSAVVEGGASRQHSVAHGIAALCPETAYFAIHDGARPLVSPETVDRVVEAARQHKAAAAAVPVKDTVKLADEDGFVRETPDRRLLWSVQTPQVFESALFRNALEQANQKRENFTDDCQLAEKAGHKVYLVKGDYRNIKITTPEDVSIAHSLLGGAEERDAAMRVGHGYDVHRLKPGRPLILGGVHIPFDKGLDGHSDADVLAHAITDAVLGAAGLGDIGGMFPDTDPQFLNADSLLLLAEGVRAAAAVGWKIGNVDATLVAQSPRLQPFIPEMRRRLAQACGMEVMQLHVKATTEEKLGFTGTGQGMAAHAVCLLVRG